MVRQFMRGPADSARPKTGTSTDGEFGQSGRTETWQQHRAAPRPTAPTYRPVRAAVLSLVWPGLGQMASGRQRTGLCIAGATAFVVGATAFWLGSRSRLDLVTAATSPSQLQAVIWVVWITMALRVAVGLDAIRVGGPRRSAPSVGQALAVTAVLSVIAAPHLIVAAYVQTQHQTVTTVFASESATTAQPSALAPDDELTETDEPDPTPSTNGPASDPSTSVPPEGPAIARPGASGRLNVALLGSDGGFDRTGVRTDTIMVISIDQDSGDAAIFSIPRNWERLPFPEGTPAAEAYPDGFDDIANAVYGLGARRPELFPNSHDPSGDAIKQALAQLLGVPIHYYVLVDMHAVVETVDLFGGIDVWVDEHIQDQIKPIDPDGPSLTIDVTPGLHHFDGHTTLAYARSRRQSSDYNRMSRQRCIMEAMIDQVAVTEVLLRYQDLTEIINDHVTTDIPTDDLPELLTVADRFDTGRIRSVNFIPPDFPDGPAPVERVREEVQRALTELTESTESTAGDDGGASSNLATACR